MSDFRLCAKKVFLTYPRCPLSPETCMTTFMSTTWWTGVSQYWISSESHSDEGSHLHVLLIFLNTLDTRNSRYFDIEYEGINYHAHLEKVKNLNHVKKYVCKDGNFICNQTLDRSNATNWIQREKDFNAWQYAHRVQKPQVEDGTVLSSGITLSFQASNKRRNYWIIGRPNCGKTYTFSTLLRPFSVYWCPPATPYPFERYDNENLIIYDDHFPKFNEIANVLNVYYHDVHVYGPVRYVTKCWKQEQVRTIVVLANHFPNYGEHQEAFAARFNVLEWDECGFESME